MNQTDEERAIGRENFHRALGAYDQSNSAGTIDRRDFLRGTLGAGGMLAAGAGGMYFGYNKSDMSSPVRVGVIGTGDEGNVLIGNINPDYIEVKAICDIRPLNLHRAFHGDWASGARSLTARPGLMSVYGWQTRAEAGSHVKIYQQYEELVKDPDIEAVIIALPLHLHHAAAMAAMEAGKHVLTEKLMARTVTQCKEMARMSAQQDVLLATGHQRHYSILYDNAVQLLRWGVLGELHHIRAQWHRGNLPGKDSWQPQLPIDLPAAMDDPNARPPIKKGDQVNTVARKLKEFQKSLTGELEKEGRADPERVKLLEHRVAQWTAWMQDADIDAASYGYQEKQLGEGYHRSALEELCRWRLWERTGAGLMAELGSHQLDAASIFISALRADGKKAQPLSVHASGGRHTFPYDRECDDHVYCQFEFPAPGYDEEFNVGYRDVFSGVPEPGKGVPSYEEDQNKKIMVTYSSINGNGHGGHGEVLMGSRGTLIMDRETEVYFSQGSNTKSKIEVKEKDSQAVISTTDSGPAASASIAAAATAGPVSRGYREQMEHWAWCIRNPAPENKPRCTPEVALGDAVIALTSKLAIQRSNEGKGGYVEYKKEWFDVDNDANPEEDLA